MAGTLGVTNTKEALLAIVTLGAFVANRLKDGAQLEDAVALGEALMVDGTFKTTVMEGVAALSHVVDECKELDMNDYLELAKVVPDLIAIVRGA